MSTTNTATSPGLVRQLERGVRAPLEALLGPERVKNLRDRVAFARRVYCVLAWQTGVPEAFERLLDESPYTFREGNRADLDTLRGIETYDDLEIYERWFDNGHRLVVALESDQVVCYSWLDFNRVFGLHDLPEYRFRMAAETCYSHEAWTLKAHRGLGLRRLLFAAELLLARDAGKKWVLGYNFKGKHVDNILRNFERIGVPRGAVVSEVDVRQGAGFRLVRQLRGPAHQAAACERLGRPRDLTASATASG